MKVIKRCLKSINDGLVYTGRYLSAMFYSPTRTQAQMMLIILGIGLLVTLYTGPTIALDLGDGPGEFNDTRIRSVMNRIFMYIEGSFGALVMVVAGLFAIVAAAFGQYRAALGLIVVAVGAFILRSLVNTFFNTGIDGGLEFV